MKKWIDALKIWNDSNKHSGTWCIPKKGTKEYDKVKGIMEGKPETPAGKKKEMVDSSLILTEKRTRRPKKLE